MPAFFFRVVSCITRSLGTGRHPFEESHQIPEGRNMFCFETFALLGCYGMYIGSELSTFRHNLSVQS
jgi:hypothetical protein